ncbi:MAG: hypothetical protein L6R39_000601 [Caloplaca ligustica]|nr:MAG: hypothetical protein L6R39_000601 [Caloplaca ligustica]
MARGLLLLFAIVAVAAAQRCQNIWIGSAPFCAPGGCPSNAYRWWGIVSKKGDGGQCWTGYKRLCQCLAPGSLDACVPTSPPKESEQLNGMFTTCNNGCSAYVCGVKFVKFWKREELPPVVKSVEGGVHRRRGLCKSTCPLLPCDEHPEQPHCPPQPPPGPDQALHRRRLLPCEDNPDGGVYCPSQPTPAPDPPSPPPPPPPNDISSTPLTPDQVHNALWQIPYDSLAAVLTSLGEDTSGRSQADLVSAAYNRFEAAMGNLDLGQVDAAASFPNFERGMDAWTYTANHYDTVPT